jgi:YD repeat-containing protein
MHQWRRKIGSSDLRVQEFVYDVDSRITEVIVNGQSTWRYETNSNGDVVQRSHHGNVRPIMVNGRGQTLQSASGKSYTYDVDGFVTRRGDETFDWNSLGRLTQSYASTASGWRKTRYYYDSLGRLSAIRSQTNSSSAAETTSYIQLFYADLKRINRVTHMYDQLTNSAVEFLYDVMDHVFALRRNGVDVYYVATDPNSTPIVIFSNTGGVLKQTDYDPLGYVLADTSQLDFPLVIGYRGAIWDHTAKLLFFDAGATVYDAELGSWMAPDYRGLVNRGRFEKELTMRPESINFYWTGFLAQKLVTEESFATKGLI